MSSFSVGLHVSLRRAKSPLLIVGVFFAAVVAVVVALVERRLGPGAVDRTVTGITFGLALPLVSLSIVHRTCGTHRLDQSFTELARHGADRRGLAFGQIAAGISICGGFGTVLGMVSVLAARGVHDPALLHDLWSTATVGAWAGAAYACWFAAASSLGKRGGGRTLFLVLD